MRRRASLAPLGQDAADGPLVGQASHADVEERPHMVQRLEQDEGGEHDRQRVADADGPRAQPGHRAHRGDRDEEQREEGVGDEDDELVAGQQAHDGAPVALTGLAQPLARAPRRARQGEGGQALDRVEVLRAQARPAAARSRGGRPQRLVEADDERGHADDGDRQDRRGDRVHGDRQEHEHERRGERRRDRRGEEGLPVQGHPLGAVGEQADRGPGALAGGVGRSQVEEVVQDAAAQGRLLGGRRAPGGGLDGGLQEGAGGSGRPGLGQQAREVGGGGAEEVAHGTSQAHQRPGLGQGGQGGHGEGRHARAPPRRGGDGGRARPPASGEGGGRGGVPGVAGGCHVRPLPVEGGVVTILVGRWTKERQGLRSTFLWDHNELTVRQQTVCAQVGCRRAGRGAVASGIGLPRRAAPSAATPNVL